MLYLLICILLNVGVFSLFRVFGTRGLPQLRIITLNYWICLVLTLGWLMGRGQLVLPPLGWWLGLGVLEGLLFVVVFRLIAEGSTQFGVGMVAVLTKLSVVVPVLVSLGLFGERLAGWQWLGVGLVLLALGLLWPRGQRPAVAGRALPLMALIFAGAGVVDTNLKLYQGWFGASVPGLVFLVVVFGVAGSAGLALLALTRPTPADAVPARGWLPAGLLLGVINWGSVVTLTLALAEVPGTVLYPINNIGQLVLAGLAGMIWFAERPSPRGWVAYACAVSAILLLI